MFNRLPGESQQAQQEEKEITQFKTVMHYYDFNVKEYRADTAHLTPMEHYIYRTLMDSYYYDERPIPKETQRVLRRLGLGTQQEPDLQNVLSDFFYMADGAWHHKRIDEELKAYWKRAKTSRENGAKGGRPRKNKDLENPDQTEQQPGENPEKPSGFKNKPDGKATSNHKPVTSNQNKKTKAKKFSFSSELKKLGVSDSVVSQYLQVRKGKRLQNTEIAFNKLVSEIEKSGRTPAAVIKHCVENSWGGFKHTWQWDEDNSSQAPTQQEQEKAQSDQNRINMINQIRSFQQQGYLPKGFNLSASDDKLKKFMDKGVLNQMQGKKVDDE